MSAVLTVDREALGEYFASREDVVFAYLFGSHARGQTHALSDVDVAVLLDDGLDSHQRFRVRLDIMGGLSLLLHTDDVDVAILNDTPLPLNFRVFRDGELLYCRDRRRRVTFVARTVSEYLDFAPSLERYNRRTIERAARGELSRGYRSHRGSAKGDRQCGDLPA